MDCMQKRFITVVRSNADTHKKESELRPEFSDNHKSHKTSNSQKIENRNDSLAKKEEMIPNSKSIVRDITLVIFMAFSLEYYS